ncbi:MAG: prepilin-type N-terminal cleavage/methylation domain-containing protein [Geobacteraceae bacterium]
MRQGGFTLVELMVVIAVMAILLSIATLNWNEMQKKTAIESQIKTMHADLMEIRLQALYGKRARSVVISGQVYKSYSSQVITSTPLETKQLRYPVTWNGGGSLTFNAQGLTNDQGSICVLPTGSTAVINSAAVDSIVVSQARINLGKRTEGACNSANIEQK